MRVLCVDDALPIMEDIVSMCKKLPQVTEVTGFFRPREAAQWLETHPVDLALLDIDMPEISGLMLAETVKRRCPDAAVVFLTAFPQYAVQAFRLRATGYLLKPVGLEELKDEVAYANSRKLERRSGHIVVQTFGNFEVFVNGETLVFHRQKAKELLAFLVDRSGKGVNRPGIFAALWEEGLYDYSKQKYLDVIIRSLRETLKEAGIEEILEIKGGFLRVRTELLDCDLYRFLKNDPEAVNAYRGEYMEEYPWAIFNTESLSARR